MASLAMLAEFTPIDAGGEGGGGEGAAADRRAVDLDALSFGQGGHLMSNRSCDLPKGSFRTSPKVGLLASHIHLL